MQLQWLCILYPRLSKSPISYMYSFTRPTLFPEIIESTPSLQELTLHGQILLRQEYQTSQFPSLCHLHLSRSIALPWYSPTQGRETSTLVVIGSAAPNLTHLCVSGVSAQNINQDLIEMLERHPHLSNTWENPCPSIPILWNYLCHIFGCKMQQQ